jgi:hypothetical protein
MLDGRVGCPARHDPNMRQLTALTLTGLLLAAGPAPAATPLDETRETLAKWVQTRQLTGKLRADWQADKETLEQSLKLFERELKTLDEQLGKTDTSSQQAQKERAELAREKEALLAASDKAKELATALEARVKSLARAFPAPLHEKIEPLLKRIPADPAATKASPAERLQTIVGILNEVDKFNGAVSVVSEIQKNPAGAEVQVKTLYLGLGQAWFVDKAGDYAGIGVPTAEGWQWQPRPELAPRISKAIAVYENTAPAAFVDLPVTLK